jgi:hypothetical protein
LEEFDLLLEFFFEIGGQLGEILIGSLNNDIP